MGASDHIVIPFFKKYIANVKEPTALLGFSNNNLFKGDLYDKSIGNWNINDDWVLPKKYSTIICTRCAYFAKDPQTFMRKCHEHMNEGGFLYVDWGLGNHFYTSETKTTKDFKVGWLKNGKQDWVYEKDNYLWSTVWDDEFTSDEQFKIFEMTINKLGYFQVKKAVLEEVPSVLPMSFIKQYFDVEYKILTIIKPILQMYILIIASRR